MASFNRFFQPPAGGGHKEEKKPGRLKSVPRHYEKLSRSPHQYREFARCRDVEQLADIIAADGDTPAAACAAV